MSAIDQTAYFSSCLPWPSGRTRILSQRPETPSGPATRTSSCCRLPSREAFSRRNTTSETSGLPTKTRSTGRASCASPRRSAPDRRHCNRRRARVDRPPRCLPGNCRRCCGSRIVGAAVGKADDAGGKGEQGEQADHRQQRQQAQDIGLRLGPAEPQQPPPPPRCRPPPAAPSRAPAAPRRFVAARGRRRMAVGFGSHRMRRCPSARVSALCAPILSA